MNTVTLAAALLEIEALLMLTRAVVLQRDRERFTAHLLEARAKLGELTTYVLTDGKEAITELFVASAEGKTPNAEAESHEPDGAVGAQNSSSCASRKEQEPT